MSRCLSSRTVVCCLFVLAFACRRAPTAESVCEDLSERLCAGLADCDCPMDARGYDAEACVQTRTEQCVDGFGAIAADLEEGRLAFDKEGVADCLAAVDALTASCALAQGRSALPDRCTEILLAPVALGAPCDLEALAFGGEGERVARGTEVFDAESSSVLHRVQALRIV